MHMQNSLGIVFPLGSIFHVNFIFIWLYINYFFPTMYVSSFIIKVIINVANLPATREYFCFQNLI